jgi:preprotein translocase subunit SecA
MGWAMSWLHPSGVAQFKPLLHEINALESKFQRQSDAELAANTGLFRERLEQGSPLDLLLPEAFAVVREVAWRTLNMRHFDVQIIGGIVLHRGAVAEMKTGEGKTLVATLPVYLNALLGKGVHVVTVNDYLATRDAEWMGQIYRFLGMDVGVIVEDMGSDADEETRLRKAAYAADITYATNSALVFDYLRDNLATELDQIVQRGQCFAIVDEVDLLLIDEVRTPLIISGPSNEDTELFSKVDRIIRKLEPKTHYKVEWRTKTSSLTEEGWAEVERALASGPLNTSENIRLFHAVYQSVQAHGAYRRDVDYLVKDGEVQLIDEHTGRVSPDKRFSDGLHQALEAKERLRVRPEDRTFARTSYQSYFRLYQKLSGMTGTASTERGEFRTTYSMNVFVIPTHKPMIRIDYRSIIFASMEDKHEAISDMIQMMEERGRPVLVGTVSVEESEALAKRLKRRSINCAVLNAKNHRKEAMIIAQAGRKSAVTISTNMAGRGTDILLGGDPEKLVARIHKPNSPGYEKALREAEIQCATERTEVVAAGGLHVIGTSLHEAKRLDLQLAGRSGRQGDPGSSQFMICLDDHIFKHYGEKQTDALIDEYAEHPEATPISESAVCRLLEALRKKVMLDHQAERAETFKYDLIIELQRKIIYQWRRELLENRELQTKAVAHDEIVKDVLYDLISHSFVSEGPDGSPPNIAEELDSLETAISNLFHAEILLPDTIDERDDPAEILMPILLPKVREIHQQRRDRFGLEQLCSLEEQILLRTIEQIWIDHLTNIEHLEDSLNLVGYAEIDPYILFRKRVTEMFQSAMCDVRRNSVALWFAIEPRPQKPTKRVATQPAQQTRRIRRRN